MAWNVSTTKFNLNIQDYYQALAENEQRLQTDKSYKKNENRTKVY